MLCQTIVSYGFVFNFILGLWDGVTVFPSLFLDIFFEVQVHNQCMDSWFYEAGFALGACVSMYLFLAIWWLLIIAVIITLLIKVLLALVVPIMWGVGLGIGVLAVVAIAAAIHQRKLPFR